MPDGRQVTPLPWGRRYLMCPPDNFGVVYEINPWMHTEVGPDPDLARAQFDNLVATLTASGAEVEMLPSETGLPDMVFTANAGVVSGGAFVPARFRHPQRQGETPLDTAWFRSNGYDVRELPAGGCQEGAGDALPIFSPGIRPVLVCGYRFRSDISTHGAISSLLGVPTRSVELADDRFYHLDLCFCPLNGRRAMVASAGFDRYGMAVIESLVPEPLILDTEEALSFCANSVVVGDVVVMPACPPRVGRILESWGFSVVVVDVGEFLKAGGGCRCLTLALDVDLSDTCDSQAT